MSSEALKDETAPLPSGKWVAYRREANGYLPMRAEILRDKTVMELVNGPHVLRFDLPRQGRVYFIGLDDELHRTLTSEDKRVRWLHDLFQGIQNKLGVASIYRWSLGKVWATKAGLDVFKGAKVEVRE
jgi:hypothetical protein